MSNFIDEVLRVFINIFSSCRLNNFKYNLQFTYCALIFMITGKVPPPRIAVIDVANFCNLKCPLCPTGNGKLNFDRSTMSFDTYKTIIDKIPSLTTVALFNWGEPFLNREIFKIIRYSKNRKIKVIVSTNFSLKEDDSFFHKMVDSGLDELYLSLDGASRKTFSKYRIGGDFDLVVSNVRKLQAIKKMLNSKSPKVIYKFMVNKYNEAEIDYAKRLANNLGIDFLAAPMYLADKSPDLNLEKNIEERKKDWLPVNKRYISTSYGGDYGEFITKNKCYQLFISIFINPDGTVFPCCWLTDKKNTFGNILHDSLEDIWNGKKYSISRRLFFSKRAFGQTTETICSKCKNFKKRNYEFS